MNLLKAEKAILHIVENTDTKRADLEDMSISNVMGALAGYALGSFHGRNLAPMFAEDKKFKVELVVFVEEEDHFVVANNDATKGLVILDLDELIELDENGQTETQLTGQHVVGFCK